MGGGVAVQALELQRDVEQFLDGVLVAPGLLQARLDLDGLGQGDRRGRVVGHHLGQAVDHAERQLHHPPDVAQHGAGLQGAEGDDLRHAVAAVALLHIADHLLPPVLAEVDVEVGHGHPLGVEEALEDQPVADRVHPGDQQAPGHQRAGARPPPRPHRHAVGHRPLHEVRDDQEVA